jgi:DNA-binding XRE family transcriptional regulator
MMIMKTRNVDKLIEKYTTESPTFKEEFEKEGERLSMAVALMKLREEAGLTQAELAEKVGKPQSTIARIESGRSNITMATIIDIAYALGKKVELKFVKKLDN